MGRRVVYGISCRLRPGRDDDIALALARLPEDVDRSDVQREALRMYFNLEGQPRAARAPISLGDFQLEAQEKSPDQLNGALDDLLGKF